MSFMGLLQKRQHRDVIPTLVFSAAALVGLLAISQVNYLLFHAVVELTAIAIAFTLFLIVWNSRRTITNGALLLLGTAYLFVAAIDLTHSLAYPGMGVFTSGSTNLAAQLWVVARGIEALSLLIAPFLLSRSMRSLTLWLLLAAYTTVAGVAMLWIFQWGTFPTCFIPGEGLTPFKIGSEAVISLLLLGAMSVFIVRRRSLQPTILWLLLASIASTIMAEVSFCGYGRLDGPLNLAGHVFKLASFYLLYVAIVRTGLQHRLADVFQGSPYERVPAGQAGIEALVGNLPQKIFYKDVNSIYLSCNEKFAQDLGIEPEDIVGKTDFDLYDPEVAERHRADDRWIMETGQTEEMEDVFTRNGEERIVQTVKIPLMDPTGKPVGILGIFGDVTEKRKAQHDYQILFDQMITGFALHEIILDESGKPIDYRFLAVNPAFEELTGLRASDLIGKTVREVLPDTEDYWIQTTGEVVLTGRPVHFENYSQALGRYYEVTAYRPAKGQFACTFVDITDRREAQASLEKSQNDLAEAQYLTHLGNWDYDLQTGELQWSNEMYHLLALDPDTPATYERFVDRIHPDDRAAYEGAMELIQHRGTARFEFRIVLPGNVIRWVRGYGRRIDGPDGNATHIFGTIQDVTENKAAQKQVRASRAFLQSILDASPDPIVVINRDRQIIRGNRAAHALTGGKSLTEMTCYELSHHRLVPCDQNEHPCPLDVVLRTRQPATLLCEHYDADENLRTVEVAAAPIFGPDGEVNSVVQIMRDMTERLALEAQLRQSQKMEAIGKLAGGVAHDFNNILSGVQGYAELLEMDLPEGSLEIEHARAISQACRRAADLTRQLLSFARKGDYRRVATDIHSIINEVAQLLRHSLSQQINISLDLHADPATVNSDPTQLQNALLNLGVNARDAMPDGGTLTIATGNVTLTDDDLQHIPYEVESGDYVEIAVRDTGVGIDAETQTKIFEPFFTTKPVGDGTGLGLAAVYGFVKNHRGSIEVDSAPYQGTTFRILLPLTADRATAGAPPSAEAIVPGQGHLLLVDDEAAIRDITAAALTKMGYTTHVCANGAEAINYYRAHGDAVDLVVLDLAMPEMSGQEVFQTLRAIDPNVRVLVASGYGDTETVHQLEANGVRGLLLKPFKIRDLSLAVAWCMLPHDA